MTRGLSLGCVLLTLQAVVSPGRTLRYEGREPTASNRLPGLAALHLK